MGAKKKPWDRQPHESAQAYAAFALYLEMPDRSLPKLLQTYPKSLDNLKALSAKWSWVERAAAYDSSIVEALRKVKIQKRKKMNELKEEKAALLIGTATDMIDKLGIKRGSYRAATEMMTLAFKLLDEVCADDESETATDKTLTINIVRAEEGDVE